MKKHVVLPLILVFAFILTGCSSKLSTEISGATKILISSGSTGETVEVTDTEAIKNITENINSLRFSKSGENKDAAGFTYTVSWLNESGSEISSITIFDSHTVVYKGTTYKGSEGQTGVDIKYIDTIVAKVKDETVSGEEVLPDDEETVNNNGNQSSGNQGSNSGSNGEDNPSSKPETGVVQPDYATDEFLSHTGTYDTANIDGSEFQVKVLLTTEETVTDFKVYGLNLLDEKSDGTLIYEVTSELYSAEKFTPDRPLVVGITFVGVYPKAGVSYVDSDGNVNNYAIAMSGKDSSLFMVKYEIS